MLDGGGSVPTVPIAGTRGGMGEDPVVPAAVLRGDGLLAHNLIGVRTSDSEWIIAVSYETSSVPGKDKAVGTGLEEALAIGIALVIVVTVFFVREKGAFALTTTHI